MSFSDDIKKWTEKTEKAATFVFRGTALDIFSKVILRTPVGNPETWVYKHPEKGYVDYLAYNDAAGYVGGRLRANWQCTLNSPATGKLEAKDKTGTQTISKTKAVTERAKLTSSLFLINNLPYAEAIEDGWSGQAPWGMVKVTVAEFKYVVDRRARIARRVAALKGGK